MDETTEHIHSKSPAGNRDAAIEQALGKIMTDKHSDAFVVDRLQTMYRHHKHLLLTSPIQSLIYRFGTNVGSPTFIALKRTSVSRFERFGSKKLVNIDHLWRIPGRLILVKDTITVSFSVTRCITLIGDHQDEVGLEHMHCIMFSRNGNLSMMVQPPPLRDPNDRHYFYNAGGEVSMREERAMEAIPRVKNASAPISDDDSESTVSPLVIDNPATTSTARPNHENDNEDEEENVVSPWFGKEEPYADQDSYDNEIKVATDREAVSRREEAVECKEQQTR
ncbi:2fe1067b-4fef-436e-aa42-ca4b2f5449b1 [Sclerotinia trifoliorum]|uniref:2fe1067b-4fef-436e-aa42-ca4b2f5449b1 n=1 Tax=Sclerotinia trifoliorum TaxID=28548 RepID=A0A8H2VL86_9HELO|nr:2fe1067b-4fef-436e-aa42-ca4b2f5449b1 [Sclerotinia trifoliorum]